VSELERIAREFYRLVAEGDYAAVIALLDKEIVWTIPGPAVVPYAGTFRGHAGVTEFFELLAEHELLESFTPEQFVVDEIRGTVCVLGSETAVSIRTGKRFDADWAEVFRIAEGRILVFEEHIDTFALAEAYSSEN
jgi:ketosteroid isomerase-like protein